MGPPTLVLTESNISLPWDHAATCLPGLWLSPSWAPACLPGFSLLELLSPAVPWPWLQLGHCPLGPSALEFLAFLGCRWGSVAATNSGLLSVCFLFCFLFLFLSSTPADLPVLPCLPLFPPFFLPLPFPPCRFLGGPGEDLERNDGSQERPYFMSPELRDILLKGSAEEGKRAEVQE